jgi:hypothetical protein
MKQLAKNNESQLQKPESKVVHIRVIFQDEDRGFKDLDLVTNTEEIFSRAEFWKMTLESGECNHEVVYEELLYNAFRPKTKLDVICNSILNYVGCHIKPESIIEKSKVDEPFEILARVFVESDEASIVWIMPVFAYVGSKDYPYFRDIWGKSDLKLTIPSRATYLTDVERTFLLRMVNSILVSGDAYLRMTFGELYGFLEEQFTETGKEEINKDFLSITLYTLQFYDFISWGWVEPNETEDDKVPPLEIIVFDLDLYEKYYELPVFNQAA